MPKMVYLDQADLAYISDGTAPHVDALRSVFQATGANLLLSQAHVYDLANADDATRERWATAATSLAPVRYAHRPGDRAPATKDRLLSLFPHYADTFKGLPFMIAAYLNAANEQRNAPSSLRAEFEAKSTKEKRRRQRELAEAKMEVLSIIGKTVDEIVDDALAPALQAIKVRGDVAEYLRRRRMNDRSRVPRASDIFDEMHASYAIHADVFTSDKNVIDLLRGAEPALVEQGCRFRMIRVGRLDEVANALANG
ncbi:MAG: hypothetical protein K8M05_38595 [Deltaproteobacteria bacterium]|nr:hypothetical protein [Kofleriaceae bacterium]